jgi:hypothetical protein
MNLNDLNPASGSGKRMPWQFLLLNRVVAQCTVNIGDLLNKLFYRTRLSLIDSSHIDSNPFKTKPLNSFCYGKNLSLVCIKNSASFITWW